MSKKFFSFEILKYIVKLIRFKSNGLLERSEVHLRSIKRGFFLLPALQRLLLDGSLYRFNKKFKFLLSFEAKENQLCLMQGKLELGRVYIRHMPYLFRWLKFVVGLVKFLLVLHADRIHLRFQSIKRTIRNRRPERSDIWDQYKGRQVGIGLRYTR